MRRTDSLEKTLMLGKIEGGRREGNRRAWDGWMASLTRWTWVWVSSRSWWWTGKPGVLQFMGLQRVGHDWVTEWNWIPDCLTCLLRKLYVCISLFLLFSCSVVSNSLWPHELQHARPPCPSPTPGAYSNSCPLSQWCHPTISSSVVPFSSCLWSFPASGSFLMSQLFTSGGQSIGASVSASILLMNIQDWFPLGWTGWISLQSKGLSRVFPTPQFRSINSSALSFLCSPTLTSIYDHWKNHSLD